MPNFWIIYRLLKTMDDKQQHSLVSRTCQNLEPCRSWLGLVAAVSAFLIISLGDAFEVYYDALVEKYESTSAAVGRIYSFRWIFISLSGKQMYIFLICYRNFGACTKCWLSNVSSFHMTESRNILWKIIAKYFVELLFL